MSLNKCYILRHRGFLLLLCCFYMALQTSRNLMCKIMQIYGDFNLFLFPQGSQHYVHYTIFNVTQLLIFRHVLGETFNRLQWVAICINIYTQ